MTNEDVLAAAGISREALGRQVRETWITWARAQPDPKPSWLASWEQLGAADQEADCLIGEELFAAGWLARDEHALAQEAP